MYYVYGENNLWLATFQWRDNAIEFCAMGCYGDYVNDGKEIIYVSLGRL